MQIKRIRVGAGMTIPLPQYSNLRPYVELEAELEEGEEPNQVHEVLRQSAKVLLMRQCFDMGEDMKGILTEGLDEFIAAFFSLQPQSDQEPTEPARDGEARERL